MDEIYWCFPENDDELLFEFVNWIEKIVPNDFIENEECINELHEIQNLCECFYEKYLKDKPNRY